MNKNLYELLRKKGFLIGNEVNSDRILKTSSKEIIDLANEVSTLTINDKIIKNHTAFVSSASASLSGGKFPCNALGCRLNSIKKLAQFAALYSDHIFIKNYLTDYASTHCTPNEEKRLLYNFAADLIALSTLEPLTREGKIVIYSLPTKKCPFCLVRDSFGKDTSIKFNHEYLKLLQNYRNRLSGKICKEDNHYSIELSGPEQLLDHGKATLSVFKELPFSKKSTLMQQLLKGQKVPLSRSQLQKLQIHEPFADIMIKDIQFELAISQLYDVSFLTDRPLQIDMLNSISDRLTLRKSNQIAQKYLTTLVPFLDDITVEDLIKLRKEEGDSFILFRQALNKAIDEYKIGGNIFTEKNAKDIYSDIIAPSLSKLDMKISSVRRTLVKSTRRETLGWVGAITFGTYTGLIPQDLTAAAASLGVVKTVATFLNKTMQDSDINESICNEEMYFLWQVRRKTKNKLQ